MARSVSAACSSRTTTTPSTTPSNGWNWGYQLKAGVSAQVAQNIAVIGEVRYNNTFDTIDGDADGIQTGTTAVLAGLRFSF